MHLQRGRGAVPVTGMPTGHGWTFSCDCRIHEPAVPDPHNTHAAGGCAACLPGTPVQNPPTETGRSLHCDATVGGDCRRIANKNAKSAEELPKSLRRVAEDPKEVCRPGCPGPESESLSETPLQCKSQSPVRQQLPCTRLLEPREIVQISVHLHRSTTGLGQGVSEQVYKTRTRPCPLTSVRITVASALQRRTPQASKHPPRRHPARHVNSQDPRNRGLHTHHAH